mmetsp:Transcript_51838/g.110150  ORF Transcript_51838/g.110150 Transcript_51838/m.110150 type:complete len:287 (+) Transcript_51838:263-1123(+)
MRRSSTSTSSISIGRNNRCFCRSGHFHPLQKKSRNGFESQELAGHATPVRGEAVVHAAKAHVAGPEGGRVAGGGGGGQDLRVCEQDFSFPSDALKICHKEVSPGLDEGEVQEGLDDRLVKQTIVVDESVVGIVLQEHSREITLRCKGLCVLVAVGFYLNILRRGLDGPVDVAWNEDELRGQCMGPRVFAGISQLPGFLVEEVRVVRGYSSRLRMALCDDHSVAMRVAEARQLRNQPAILSCLTVLEAVDEAHAAPHEGSPSALHLALFEILSLEDLAIEGEGGALN